MIWNLKLRNSIRHLVVIIIVYGILVGIISTPSYAGILTDSVVESAVRLSINKPSGVITVEDCLKVKDLNINVNFQKKCY